jgi:hypothetical protein
MVSFLAQRDLIAHAAAQLATNRRDPFALNLLIEFDTLDKVAPDAAVSPDASALRASLRRMVENLLSPDAMGADAEIATIRRLTEDVSAKLRRPRRFRVLVLLLAAGIGAVSVLPVVYEKESELDRVGAEVTELQKRVAEVANEKARAQDDKEYAASAAKQLAEVATYAASITDDLELCIRYGNDVIQIAIDIGKDYTFNQSELDRFFNKWTEVCDRARADAAALRDYVNQ